MRIPVLLDVMFTTSHGMAWSGMAWHGMAWQDEDDISTPFWPGRGMIAGVGLFLHQDTDQPGRGRPLWWARRARRLNDRGGDAVKFRVERYSDMPGWCALEVKIPINDFQTAGTKHVCQTAMDAVMKNANPPPHAPVAGPGRPPDRQTGS